MSTAAAVRSTPPEVRAQMMGEILIIEDDIVFRAFLREVLVREGYTVKEASTGREGLRMCRESSVPLVVTDIMMPDVDGLEVIRALRQGCPQTKIIAISGGCSQWSGPSMLDLAKQLGADIAYDKPFDTQDFLRGLRELGRTLA